MRRRHVPYRMCVACRQTRDKRALIRIVRVGEERAVVDESGRLAGRGAYLCPSPECWEKALRDKKLDQALKTHLSEESRQSLREYSNDRWG